MELIDPLNSNFPRCNSGDLNETQLIKAKNGLVKVTYLSSLELVREFELEYTKRNSRLPIVWALAMYCFLKNNALAYWKKSRTKSKISRQEILWN